MSAIENEIRAMSDLQINTFIRDLRQCQDNARIERKALKSKSELSKDGKVINKATAMRMALLNDIKRYGALLEMFNNEKKRRGGQCG